MASLVENWDDDADFQGDLFSASQSTAPPSISSRLSVRSESVAGDEEWQVLVPQNDNLAQARAIVSAKQIGIPLPHNIPASALLGGTIKKLGKKPSRRNIAHDDWGDDLEIPTGFTPQLVVKKDVMMPDAPQSPSTPANLHDDFDTDWAEGSLGIRFAGTRRDQRGRSSSVTALSPSIGSCMTLESEDDDFGGLVLPEEHIDFSDRLKKRKEAGSEPHTPDIGGDAASANKLDQPSLKKLKVEDEDPLFGLDFGTVDLTDKRKRKLHPAIKINESKVHPSPPRMATTSLTFTDKPTVSRIPRPTPSTTTKLDPVYESMASHIAPRLPRITPTTTAAQLLRSKRSAPALTTRQRLEQNTRPPVPFLPISHRNAAQPAPRPLGHGRHHSDHDRPAAEPVRSASRASTTQHSSELQTPSRLGHRRDVAPAALARQAVNQRTLQVTKRRNFGDGSELNLFDDLPTSATKEQKFVKEPSARAPARTLRRMTSKSRLPIDRNSNSTPQPHQSYPSSVASTVPSTPLAPPTPRSGYFPTRVDNTPRFARDTAASRNAREQRLSANSQRRDSGPLHPISVNWKAQVAARNPHNSPTAQRKKPGETKKPFLIKQLSHSSLIKNEHGMTYNPAYQRWEGNDHALAAFNNPSAPSLRLLRERDSFPSYSQPSLIPLHHGLAPLAQPRQASPPRPALITPMMAGNTGIRVERGMVFDPQQMRWLRLDPRSVATDSNVLLSPGSISVEEEEDPFAGLEDLKDDKNIVQPGTGGDNKENMPSSGADWAVGEEFDVGPSFIKRQRVEEDEWRRRVELWMNGRDDNDERWKWEVREVARDYESQSLLYR